MNNPVIFLAFANVNVNDTHYLRSLAKEHRGISEVLRPAEKNLFEIEKRVDATIKDIFDVFQDKQYKNRIAIFHFGGHASGYKLLLESWQGGPSVAHKKGLVSFLSGQQGLKFVFLNGCSTEQHALELMQAGIPAVVGTSQYIADDVAADLAIRFYSGLANGHPLARAWKDAVDEITTRKGESNFRDFYCVGKVADRFPWDIHYKKGAENVKNWNLPDAADDPLFGLPKIPAKYRPPEEPYLFLKSYERKHAKVFFGRSYYIREIYNMIDHRESPGIILLHGQSGVGKSSLLDAGLTPRLEESHHVIYTRRIQEKGLSETLNEALKNYLSDIQSVSAPEGLKILEKWKSIESGTSKPLVFVLDQVEEMYTHSNDKLPRELEDFSSALVEIFGNPEDCPQGKLILSYRKEYHAEIDEELKRKELPRSPMFIETLSRRDIREVVTGITSTYWLRKRYNLKIGPDLAESIAYRLSDDANSPVAPVLQLILTKMWQKVVPDHTGNRTFTIELYRRLRRQGIMVGDFFKQQMKKLQAVYKQEVKSGLALDILKFHTTDLGTAAAKSMNDIKKAYSHNKGKSKKITEKMKELFLLTDQYSGKHMTRLAHDTLAPIVIKEYNKSNKPGQRAARILAAKMKEFKKSGFKNLLDEADLDIVEKGKFGMKALIAYEVKLLAISNKRKIQNRKLLDGAKASQLNSIAQSKVKKDPTMALRIAEQAFKIDKDKNVSRTIHTIYRENIFYKIVMRQETPISAVSISLDGKYILTGFRDGTICLWDSKGKKVRDFNGHTQVVNSVAFSTDKKYILSGSSDKSARVWDRETGSELKVFKIHRKVNTVAFSSSGNYILTGSTDGITRIWDPGKDEPLDSIEQKKEVNFAAFSPNDKCILTRTNNKPPILWDRKGKKIQDFKGHKAVTSVTFSPDGKFILTGAKDGTTRLWDLKGKKIQLFRVHKKGGRKRAITAVSYSRENKLVLTGAMDGTIRLWDLQGKLLQVFKGHTNQVTFAAFLNKGKFILSGAKDDTIRKWDLQGDKFKIYQGHVKAVNSVAFSRDNKCILTGSNDKTAILWPRKGKKKDFTGHEKSVTSVALSSNSKWVLTGSMDKTARLWDPGDGKELKVFNGHLRAVNSVAISHDDKYILTGSSDKTAILWDPEGENREGTNLQAFQGHRCGVTSVTFSPDSLSVLTGSKDKTARLWDLTGEKIVDFKAHKDYVTAVVFSPCGKYILTGSRDETARLWNLKGNVLKVFEGHNEAVNSVAFFPYRKEDYKQYYILTGSRDNTAILWDGEGNRLQDFIGHKDSITSVTFSPDGKFILTGSKDKTTRLWEIKLPLESFLKSGDCEKLSKEQKWEYGI